MLAACVRITEQAIVTRLTYRSGIFVAVSQGHIASSQRTDCYCTGTKVEGELYDLDNVYVVSNKDDYCRAIVITVILLTTIKIFLLLLNFLKSQF